MLVLFVLKICQLKDAWSYLKIPLTNQNGEKIPLPSLEIFFSVTHSRFFKASLTLSP